MAKRKRGRRKEKKGELSPEPTQQEGGKERGRLGRRNSFYK